MFKVIFTNKMKRDVKLMEKRGKNMSKLYETLKLLANGAPMPPKYHDHPLGGEFNEYRECHIEGDWLLMYRIYENKLILSASATGTHSDLFGR